MKHAIHSLDHITGFHCCHLITAESGEQALHKLADMMVAHEKQEAREMGDPEPIITKNLQNWTGWPHPGIMITDEEGEIATLTLCDLDEIAD